MLIFQKLMARELLLFLEICLVILQIIQILWISKKANQIQKNLMFIRHLSLNSRSFANE